MRAVYRAMVQLPRIDDAADAVLGCVQHRAKASMRRLSDYLRRHPLTTEHELQQMLERIGIRLLIPPLRTALAELGKQIERDLRDWHASIQMAQAEDNLPAEVGYWHSQHLQEVWRRVSRRKARQVAQRVIEGLEQGEQATNTMDAVAQILGNLAAYELERIVRTETTRYYNYAVVYETASYPEVVGYRYAVVVDDRTSEVCRPLAGKVVRREQLQLVPPLHPNCRTILVPLLEEDMAGKPMVDPERDYEPLAYVYGILPRFLAQRLLGIDVSPTATFWRVWQEHEQSIRKLCFSIAHSSQASGEDLYTEAMLRAYDRYYQYNPKQSTFLGWVYRVARSIYLNARKRESCEYHTTHFDGAEFED
jgi:SPP1 gp7 family putative phage head morphogenesis protein